MYSPPLSPTHICYCDPLIVHFFLLHVSLLLILIRDEEHSRETCFSVTTGRGPLLCLGLAVGMSVGVGVGVRVLCNCL